MLIPGLCSVTLRGLEVGAVADLAAECGLRAIEWGADVHVPPSGAGAAARAAAASVAAGVAVTSYGSYLFAGGVEPPEAWRPVLDTAVALGAATVRVWSPVGDGSVPPGYVGALGSCAADAADAGLDLALEFHGGTATASVGGVRSLFDAVAAPNLFTYWQPPYWRGTTDAASDRAAVEALGDRLAHLHVYEWAATGDRRPLAEGSRRWPEVLAAASVVPTAFSGPRVALLEFVADDDPDRLRRDAATLRAWLAED